MKPTLQWLAKELSDLLKDIAALNFPKDPCGELITCTLVGFTVSSQSIDQEQTQESDAGSLWTPLKQQFFRQRFAQRSSQNNPLGH